MKVLAVEDEIILLKHLTNRIHDALPEAEILAFDNTDDVLDILPETEADIAFLDIAIGEMNGVDLAKRIKTVHPCCDINNFVCKVTSIVADSLRKIRKKQHIHNLKIYFKKKRFHF